MNTDEKSSFQSNFVDNCNGIFTCLFQYEITSKMSSSSHRIFILTKIWVALNFICLIFINNRLLQNDITHIIFTFSIINTINFIQIIAGLLFASLNSRSYPIALKESPSLWPAAIRFFLFFLSEMRNVPLILTLNALKKSKIITTKTDGEGFPLGASLQLKGNYIKFAFSQMNKWISNGKGTLL